MRFSLGLAGIVLLLVGRPAAAQGVPGEMSVAVPDVDVRSGPGPLFNVTGKLRQGDRVVVVADSKPQPGWVAIKPPPDSFSWIEAKYLLKRGTGSSSIAAVIGEGPVDVRPGSILTAKAPDRVSTSVKPGSLVVVMGKETVTDAGTYLPIEPPPQDVRYVPQEALKPLPTVAAVSNPPPPPIAPTALITQADQAFAAGQVEQAKQLYRQALERPLDYQQQVYCQNRLASLSGGQPPRTASTSGLAGQTMALSRTNPNAAPTPLTQQPQWSVWGQLRATAFQKDGLPMYVLENRQGTPLLYVTTQAGFSLRDYIGKTVSLYGPVTYRSDEYMRMHYMTASHVATLP